MNLTTAALETEYAETSGTLRPAGHIHYSAPLTRHHLWQDQLAAERDTAQVDFDGSPPVLLPDLPEWSGRSADSGVVDEQVDGAEFGTEFVHGGCGGVRVAEIRAGRGRDAAGRLDKLHGLRELVGGPSDQANRGAGTGQRECQHPSEATSPPVTRATEPANTDLQDP